VETINKSQNAGEWENNLTKLYDEEEIISILNILSYLDNQRRGYGKLNDEECYTEERNADKNNRLYDEALRGLELLEIGRSRRLKKARISR